MPRVIPRGYLDNEVVTFAVRYDRTAGHSLSIAHAAAGNDQCRSLMNRNAKRLGVPHTSLTKV